MLKQKQKYKCKYKCTVEKFRDYKKGHVACPSRSSVGEWSLNWKGWRPCRLFWFFRDWWTVKSFHHETTFTSALSCLNFHKWHHVNIVNLCPCLLSVVIHLLSAHQPLYNALCGKASSMSCQVVHDRSHHYQNQHKYNQDYRDYIGHRHSYETCAACLPKFGAYGIRQKSITGSKEVSELTHLGKCAVTKYDIRIST